MSEADLRAEVVQICRLLHQRGYLAANDGNVSVRCGDLVLVTPTGVHKGFLSPEHLLLVDLDGRVAKGAGQPSGELPMHLAALRARPDAQGVVHAHPPTCIALSLANKRLNGFLPEVVLSIGRFEVVPYARPLSKALADSVVKPLQRSDALILQRHGTLAVGKDLVEAYSKTERLEHAAHVLWLAYSMGNPRPLPEQELRALEELYEAGRDSTA